MVERDLDTQNDGFHKEIERRFLVGKLPYDISDFPSSEIIQGYVEISEDGQDEIRVRKKDDAHFLTTKQGLGESRDEREECIEKEDYSALFPSTDGRVVEKTRTYYPIVNYTAEVDLYHGPQEGFMTIEVEFPNDEESNGFVIPDWFGEEITGVAEYSNRSFALKNQESLKLLTKPEAISVDGLSEFLALIKERSENKKDGEPTLVFVSGRTSSGKTTAVTSRVVEEFGDVTVLSMDDYSKGNSFIALEEQRGNEINWDHPDYIDFELLRDHIEKLKQGKAIEKPIYSFITGEREGYEEVKPAKFVVVEGLFALRDEIADLADARGFVDISLHGSIIRRLLRDVARTGMKPDQILKYYLSVVEPMYQQHIANTQTNADVVITNEYNPQEEASKSEDAENQLKFVGSISPEIVIEVGGKFLSESDIEDIYYNPHDRKINESGESIRIRTIGNKKTLTYKGPKKPGDVRIRPKLEFDIDDETAELFAGIYGNNSKIVLNKRKLFEFDGSFVAIDKVSTVNNSNRLDMREFVEIQAGKETEPSRIRKISEILGFNFNDRILQSYEEI